MTNHSNLLKLFIACCSIFVVLYMLTTSTINMNHVQGSLFAHGGWRKEQGRKLLDVAKINDTEPKRDEHNEKYEYLMHSWIQPGSPETRMTIQEKVLFDNLDDDVKTDPKETQLFYADSVKLITDYRISKYEFCAKHPNIRTVVFVWSRVTDTVQRNAIRQTWANQTYAEDSTIKVLFVLGSNNQPAVQSRVETEDRLYGDILQFSFADSYHNCTLKSIGVLRWTQLFCNGVEYVMKIDDDFLVNTGKLQEFQDQHKADKMTIYGFLAHQYKRHVNRKSKWYVSAESWPHVYYPDFIVGPHIMTSDCVTVLYDKCLKTLPALWLEDVYITGVLANGTDISRLHEKLFVRLDVMGKKGSAAKGLFADSLCMGHDFKAQSMYSVWKELLDAGLVAR